MAERLPWSTKELKTPIAQSVPPVSAKAQRWNRPGWKSLLWLLVKALFFSVLPFIVLIRGAVWLHTEYAFHPWVSILLGMLGSAAILFLLVSYFQYRWRLKSAYLNVRNVYFIAFVLVLAYCVPGLLFLKPANAKYPAVQEEFRSLHPILRLGISTLVFLDKSVLITDANRQPEDYRKMGLKTKKHSLHYTQSDGYAHAVDIRTKGHGMIRNWLVEQYFSWMGFQTLRHVGTADHLHVSLMSHDRPGAW